MNALAPVSDKLSKLIPRLASNHDGEVLATARAIERTLKSAGLDWHALANALEAPPERKAAEINSWVDLALWCCQNDHGRFGIKEHEFCGDMANRLVLGGEPSEKQAAWLRAIYAKLHKANGGAR